MEKMLNAICGLRVTDAVFAEGDAGIIFENGISLTVYNRYVLEGLVLRDSQLLIDKIVTHVDEEMDFITIRFDNNCALRIDMRDEAYTGPEAMQLRVPGEPIVVWS